MIWFYGLLVLDQIAKESLLHFSRSAVSLNSGLALNGGSATFLVIGFGLLLFLKSALRAEDRPVWFLIVLAAASNLLDRLLVGGVIDYLNFGPVKLNLADIIIVGSVLWLLSQTTKKDAD